MAVPAEVFSSNLTALEPKNYFLGSLKTVLKVEAASYYPGPGLPLSLSIFEIYTGSKIAG